MFRLCLPAQPAPENSLTSSGLSTGLWLPGLGPAIRQHPSPVHPDQPQGQGEHLAEEQ